MDVDSTLQFFEIFRFLNEMRLRGKDTIYNSKKDYNMNFEAGQL